MEPAASYSARRLRTLFTKFHWRDSSSYELIGKVGKNARRTQNRDPNEASITPETNTCQCLRISFTEWWRFFVFVCLFFLVSECFSRLEVFTSTARYSGLRLASVRTQTIPDDCYDVSLGFMWPTFSKWKSRSKSEWSGKKWATFGIGGG